MLITELCTSRDLSETESAAMLEKALAKSQLHLPEPM
jgi:hypothetical protein